MPPRFIERFCNRKVKQGTSITLSVKVEGLLSFIFLHAGHRLRQILFPVFRIFPCHLYCLGSPTPTVSWLKEESMEDVLWIKPDTKGYKIASSGRQHSLILMDVGTEYTGAYTCIATNKGGQSVCTALLEVDDGKFRRLS